MKQSKQMFGAIICKKIDAFLVAINQDTLNCWAFSFIYFDT